MLKLKSRTRQPSHPEDINGFKIITKLKVNQSRRTNFLFSLSKHKVLKAISERGQKYLKLHSELKYNKSLSLPSFRLSNAKARDERMKFVSS